jgi:pilus assembly protein Flp/PilA
MTKEIAGMRLKAFVSNFLEDESGQDLIEYALVAAIIALGAVTAMGPLANNISNIFNSIGNKLTAAS